MGTDKRARQKANRAARKLEVEEEEAKEHREESTKKFGKWIVVAAILIALFVLFQVLGGDDDGDSSTVSVAPQTEEAAPAVQEVPSEIVFSDTVPADFVPFAGEGALATVTPAARNDVYSAAPPTTIDPARTYAAVLNTTIGPVRVALFVDEAPVAVNNFVTLARDGFYDGLTFYRVFPTDRVEAGDPLADGTGGPGYTFDDEINPEQLFDRPGLFAMDNDGPNSNGSRFFITLRPNEGFDGDHTIFGELAGPIATLEDIPDPSSGLEVAIDSILIIEGEAPASDDS